MEHVQCIHYISNGEFKSGIPLLSCLASQLVIFSAFESSPFLPSSHIPFNPFFLSYSVPSLHFLLYLSSQSCLLSSPVLTSCLTRSLLCYILQTSVIFYFQLLLFPSILFSPVLFFSNLICSHLFFSSLPFSCLPLLFSFIFF